jgi:glyoxylase-like metal-dependent hydrolase (beta-lactamase superfamily II)
MLEQIRMADLWPPPMSFTLRSMVKLLVRLLQVALIAFAVVQDPLFAADALQPQKVAEGVHAFVGAAGPITAANRGFVGNSGFIVGKTGVVVIDTGSSYLHGKRMLDAIARVTDKPVVLVIITHAVQEFVFGSQAFVERGIPLLAHSETTKLMKARCDHCLDNLRPLLGAELEGTRLVIPQREVSATTTVDAGGRPLELYFFGWASTPGDLAIFDRTSGVLFAGGMVAIDSIPDIRDSDFDGWQRALPRLAELKPTRVVPGHGPVADAGAIAATASYLDALDRKMRSLYAQSTSLMDSVEKAVLPDYRDWASYATTQRQNALHRYLQLELLDLGGDPRSTALPSR